MRTGVWTPLRRSSVMTERPSRRGSMRSMTSDVVDVFSRHEEAALAVAGMVGNDAGLAKRLGQIGGGFEVVFDNQNLHVTRDHSDPRTPDLRIHNRFALGVIFDLPEAGSSISRGPVPKSLCTETTPETTEPRKPWPARLPDRFSGRQSALR